jgi:hypothetical protein
MQSYPVTETQTIITAHFVLRVPNEANPFN